MFEIAEVPRTLSRKEYDERLPKLREQLLAAQRHLRKEEPGALIIVVAGLEAAGRGETINLLNTWLDPRHVSTHGMGEPSDEERHRPHLWQFWRRLPPRGETGIFFGSWYTDPIWARTRSHISVSDLDREMERVRSFERMLTDERIILLKLWFHLTKPQQRRRLKALARDEKTSWRVNTSDWKRYRHHKELVLAARRALRLTSTDNAPWIVVPSDHVRFRNITVGQAVLDALQREPAAASPTSSTPSRAPADGKLLVHTLDLTQSLERTEYKELLSEYQGKFHGLIRSKRFRKRSLVMAFEGMDAAGKGGAIRRVVSALDARWYQVIPIAAPTDEEAARPYLWRFWRHAPRRGKVVVFDRSWYGRVLVERVEGFCTPADWQRAYSEINDFEEQLTEAGTVVVKLWLHIDSDEQLRRFKEREATPIKRHKITPEDWRNRERWGDYELAVEDMIRRTSTEIAPWTMIEGNNKLFARIKVLRTICDQLEAKL